MEGHRRAFPLPEVLLALVVQAADKAADKAAGIRESEAADIRPEMRQDCQTSFREAVEYPL